MSLGEKKAWEILLKLNPQDVCKNADVSYDKRYSSYILKSFGMDFSISPEKRQIKGLHPEAESLVKRLCYFFNHSALYYLINAHDISFSGRLIRPENVRGGGHFFRGSHLLPLDGLADIYKNGKDDFIKRGLELGGQLSNHGDASILLLPFPRVPVILILWLEDEEFPARADILFDSTAEIHLPLDIIWSAAMMSIMLMM